MQTIKLDIEDSIYKNIVNSGINIQSELKKMIERLAYQKEYQITDKIKDGLSEVELYKSGQVELTNAKDFLNELKNEY